LNLFRANGTAGANLPRLLENMTKVEISPLATRAGLIASRREALRRECLAPAIRAASPPTLANEFSPQLLPFPWNHEIERELLNFKALEHVLFEKAGQILVVSHQFEFPQWVGSRHSLKPH
jgi:hypothetical protein